MRNVSIIRESDDPIADVRISLGSPKGSNDFYLVFRGEPDRVIELLQSALGAAKLAMPIGGYDDHR